MPLYIVVNFDGTQQRVSPSPMDIEAGQTLEVDNRFDEEPSTHDYVWNVATRAYEEVVQPGSPSYSRTRLTKREFRARLGAPCRIAINERIATAPASAAEIELIASLQDLKDELLSVDFVELTHPTTVAAVQMLEQYGYLTSVQATAVLAPSTVVEE